MDYSKFSVIIVPVTATTGDHSFCVLMIFENISSLKCIVENTLVYVKKNVILLTKFVHRCLIRNAPHFYDLPLDLCGKRIAALFAKLGTSFANAPRFGEMCHIF